MKRLKMALDDEQANAFEERMRSLFGLVNSNFSHRRLVRRNCGVGHA